MLRLSCKLMDVESVGDFSEFSHFVIKPSHLPEAKTPKESVVKAQDFNAGLALQFAHMVLEVVGAE